MQVRVWVPAAVMRRAQAMMVQGTGPGSSGLTLTVLSDFQESSVPLQVGPACSCTHLTSNPTCTICSILALSRWISPAQWWRVCARHSDCHFAGLCVDSLPRL